MSYTNNWKTRLKEITASPNGTINPNTLGQIFSSASEAKEFADHIASVRHLPIKQLNSGGLSGNDWRGVLGTQIVSQLQPLGAVPDINERAPGLIRQVGDINTDNYRRRFCYSTDSIGELELGAEAPSVNLEAYATVTRFRRFGWKVCTNLEEIQDTAELSIVENTVNLSLETYKINEWRALSDCLRRGTSMVAIKAEGKNKKEITIKPAEVYGNVTTAQNLADDGYISFDDLIDARKLCVNKVRDAFSPTVLICNGSTSNSLFRQMAPYFGQYWKSVQDANAMGSVPSGVLGFSGGILEIPDALWGRYVTSDPEAIRKDSDFQTDDDVIICNPTGMPIVDKLVREPINLETFPLYLARQSCVQIYTRWSMEMYAMHRAMRIRIVNSSSNNSLE